MSTKQKILIADDDANIAELISLYLEKEGFETRKAENGRQALEILKSYAADLIVLDIMMPEMDGYEVCRTVRKDSAVTIIMLTAKGETFDKVLGLELGADDYMVKPFDTKELVARVKAVLRRSAVPERGNDKKISYPGLVINLSNYSVTFRDRDIEMPPKELELLHFLASHPNQVFTREQLLNQIWGYEYYGDTRTVDVHIKRIREKLDQGEDNGSWSIKTVWGVGYKFEVK
ncbi:MAG: response regulator transcription factor [Firmicutes bacterium]|nr:response regulator transcription factor [Bacillota bacterium]